MSKILVSTILSAAALSMAAGTPAVFPGGEQALQEYITANLIYPQPAKDNGIEGIVTLDFTVKADGSVGTIKVQRMIDPDLEQAAITLVRKMPAWTPATDDAGKAVDSTVTLPVTFSLGD